MQLDDVLRPASPIAGNFTHAGFPARHKLGDTRAGLQSNFEGGTLCLAPVFGQIEIPLSFLFAGSSTFVKTYAVVGKFPQSEPNEQPMPAIRFSTDRSGAVGGKITLEVNARLEQFEYLDRTNPGGLGTKEITIDGISGKVRIIAEGNANKADFRLSINGRKAGLWLHDGPELKAETHQEDGWFVVTVTDC